MKNCIIQSGIPSSPQEPYRFTKRHGSTTFLVSVHFDRESGDTAGDKIARLLRNEMGAGKVVNL